MRPSLLPPQARTIANLDFKRRCADARVVAYFVPVGGFMLTPRYDDDAAELGASGRPVLMIANHTSFFDTLLFAAARTACCAFLEGKLDAGSALTVLASPQVAGIAANHDDVRELRESALTCWSR